MRPRKAEPVRDADPPATGWADHSERFRTDSLLRSRGWVIWSRPRDGPDLWRRDGVVRTTFEALLEE